MKHIQFLSILLIVLAVPASVMAQGNDPRYLAQMPSWEQIKGQINGSDAMDTAARQMGACWQLRQVIYDLAWATQRRGRGRLTPDETRMVSDYDTGYLLASTPYLPIQNTPAHPERKKWYELHSFYEGDTEFLDDLLNKLTPAEFRTGYYKALGKQPPSRTAAVRSSASPSSQPGTANTPSASSEKQAQLTAYFNEGEQFYKAKDYEHALESFKKALALDPGADSHFLVGMCYSKLRQFENALASFQQAYRLRPDAESAGEVAFCLSNLGQMDKSIATYQEAIRLDPKDSDSYEALGRILMVSGRFSEAVTNLQRALQLEPDEPYFKWQLGTAYVLTGRKDLAARIQQDLSRQQSNLAELLSRDINDRNGPAGVLNNIGLPELVDNTGIALTAFRSAQKLSPNNAVILSDAAFGFSVLGQTDEAIQAYRSIIKANPSTEQLALAHRGLGDMYARLKDSPRAIASYQESLRVMPTAACHASLGELYMSLDQFPKALAAFQEAVRLQPESYEQHLRLGRFYARSDNQLGKAIASLQEAARLAGKKSSAPNLELGKVYFRLNQYPAAVTAYSEAIRISPNDPEAHYGLGLVYRALRKKTEALHEYETLKKLDSKLAAELASAINSMH